MELKDPIEIRLHQLTKNFDYKDWRTLRNENYWWVTHPVTNEKKPRDKYSRLQLTEYYVKHGVPKPI